MHAWPLDPSIPSHAIIARRHSMPFQGMERARHGCPSEKSSLKHRNQLPDDHASRHMHAYGSACFMNARARACQVQIEID
jgi:hypothetical protein